MSVGYAWIQYSRFNHAPFFSNWIASCYNVSLLCHTSQMVNDSSFNCRLPNLQMCSDKDHSIVSSHQVSFQARSNDRESTYILITGACTVYLKIKVNRNYISQKHQVISHLWLLQVHKINSQVPLHSRYVARNWHILPMRYTEVTKKVLKNTVILTIF